MRKYLLVFIATLVQVFAAQATHFVAGNIEYECLGGNQYRVTFISYFDCNFSSASPPTFVDLQFTSSCGTFNSQANPLILDPSTGSTVQPITEFLCESQRQCSECDINSPNANCPEVLPGIEKLVYETTVTINDCSDWVISFSSCCRNDPPPNISNHPGSGGYYTYTLLDNISAPCNSSPSFFSNLRAYICEDELTVLDFSSNDPDGDVLRYSLVDPLDGPGTSININAGYDAENFILVSDSIRLDSLSGLMTFTPSDGINGTDQTAFLSVQVNEYRGGVLIGRIIRDVQLVTMENCEPMAPFSTGIGTITDPATGQLAEDNYINDSTIFICAGDELSWTITLADTTYGDSLFITTNFGAKIPNSSFTSSVEPGITTAHFYVNPDNDDVGEYTYNILVENNGCPVKVQEIFEYKIVVFGRTDAFVDIDTTCFGQTDSIFLWAEGGEVFNWTVLGVQDTTWVECDTCFQTLALPPRTVDYVVTSDLDQYDCSNKDTVHIEIVQPPVPLEDIEMCFNDTARMVIDWEWRKDSTDGVYIWNDDKTFNDTLFETTNAGAYWYVLRDTVNFVNEIEDTLVRCVWRDTVEVVLIDCPVNAPNIFTPNLDGHNDYFVVKNIEGKVWNLVVYSRWGKKVLKEMLDYKNNWDGDDLADGVYFYRLTNQEGAQITELKGWVQISR